MIYDLVIIGGSAAATAAGIYAARRNLQFKIITHEFGGEVATSGEIGNWPGISQTDGITLAQMFKDHLAFYKVVPEEGVWVEKVAKQDGGLFRIEAKSGEEKKQYLAKTLLIATGVHPKALGVLGEKEFRNKGVSYCTVCLPPKSMIVGNNEPKAIETFKPGDRVLTDDGTYQPILKIMNRPYKGDLVNITSRFFLEDEVKLTPNHPVLATTLKKGTGENYHNFQWGDFSWVPAGELTPDHLLAYPIVKETEDIPEIFISKLLNLKVQDGFVINKRETHTSIRVPDKINTDNDFFRLVGYYLAEGSRNGYTTTLYFSKKEKHYVNDVVQLIERYFGISPNVRTVGPVTRIDTWSMIFSELFENLFGHRSYNKSLPHWVTILPLEKQAELIKGLWRGDGCKRYKDYMLVTNSFVLVTQVKNILLRLGIVPSIRKIGLDKLKQSKINGRIIYFRHPKYEVTVGGASLKKMSEILDDSHPRVNNRNRICTHAYIKDGFVLLAIRKIGRGFYNGSVYNLVVDKNHSYVTTNSIVHNCDGPVFAGKITAVVGGGNSALEAALMLADICPTVYVVNKNPQFKGDQILIDNLAQKKNVQVIYSARTTAIVGDEFVSGLKYTDADGAEQELKVDGIFVHIGMVPNSGLVTDDVKKDQFGQIMVNQNCETNIPGLYAAGDVTDIPHKQIVIAAGMGTTALLSAVNYLNRQK